MNAVVIILSALFAVVASNSHHCYDDVISACSSVQEPENGLAHCNSRFSGFHAVQPDLQEYANDHIFRSFDYLLMSTHFSNYEKNREGFAKLFRKLSDTTWEDAINLIKYVNKRGGSMAFRKPTKSDEEMKKLDTTYEFDELASLAHALDSQKVLAEEAHRIHGEVTRKRPEYHDPEVGSYLEEHFTHKHAESVRKLSGLTNDLKNLITDNKATSLAVFLFDEYMQKSL